MKTVNDVMQKYTAGEIELAEANEKLKELGAGISLDPEKNVLTEEEKKNTPNPTEKWCTQEERQIAYDNWETTDDHGMQIYGIAKDQNGVEYYMVKNSWGEAGTYKGIWYASKAFTRYKTMNIVVHKNAIPKDIRKKLGIK